MNARTLTLVALTVAGIAGAAWIVARGQSALDTARQTATDPVVGDDEPPQVQMKPARPAIGVGAEVRDALQRPVAVSPSMRDRLAALRRGSDGEPAPASVAAELAGSLARWNGIVEAAVRDATPAHAQAVRGASAGRVEALRALDADVRAGKLDQAATRAALHEGWNALRADVPKVVADPAAAQRLLDGLAGPDGEPPFPR